jgi:myb proto-oncogene protein
MPHKRRSDDRSPDDEGFSPDGFEQLRSSASDTEADSEEDELCGPSGRGAARKGSRSARDPGQPWSQSELTKLLNGVNQQLVAGDATGQQVDWAYVAAELGRRSAKQCREKWRNDLRPGTVKGEWSWQEEMVLVRAHGVHGTSWSTITRYLPRRAENCCKNRW